MSEIQSKLEKHLTVTENGLAIVDFLADSLPFSKQQIKSIMQKGAVWIEAGKKTQRVRRAKRMLKQGEIVHFYYDQHVLDIEPVAPVLIADYGHYSVWNKPFGLLSQGSKWGDHCTVTRWAEQHLKPQRSSFVVHRLDRAANGLIIVAHEKKAAAALSALFQTRDVEKRYQIWVQGQFDPKTSRHPVKVKKEIDGRQAASYFSFVDYDEAQNRSLLDVSIETGRKHQIRRHSAELGFPVIGDRLYGDDHQENLQLCAYYMRFKCPFTQTIREFNLLQ
jgi:tRNA pseudouridine32 synthase/23S rRNA pseudouridine746 synthase